jgi:hypothetical protein
MFDETCNHVADMQEAINSCRDFFVHNAEIKKPARRPACYMRLMTEFVSLTSFRGQQEQRGPPVQQEQRPE